MLGMLIGTATAIGLVLISPNMTYPKAVKAEVQKMLEAAPGRLAAIDADLASGDLARLDQAKKAKAAFDKAMLKARGDLEKYKHEETSIVGLEKPLFALKNPGLISIPLGFLAVIVGSLMYRDPKADEMWDELYVRQNTGILAAKAMAH